MKVSFVIPCYNSEKTVGKVVADAVNAISEMERRDYEVILVNDCSGDGTWDVIKEICSQNPHVKGICFAKNFGQHSALMAGYREASGDVIISLDDDGQTPANEACALITKIEEGYDVVYASYKSKKHSVGRNIGTRLNNFMCEKLLHKPKNLQITSFFAARRFIIDEITAYSNSFTYVPGLVLRTTGNIASVPVEHRERTEGRSGYNFWKLLALWMNGFTAFSVLPLRISTFTGVCSAAIGFLFLIYVVIRKILNPDSVLAGWSSMIAVILLLGGLILLVLGIIGEYLGRVYISINKSPQYVIKCRTWRNNNEIQGK